MAHSKVVLFLFCTFNFIFFCLGVSVFSAGIYGQLDSTAWRKLVVLNTLYQAVDIFVVAGIGIALIGFLGCYGAYVKSTWVIVLYIIITIIVFIVKITACMHVILKEQSFQAKLARKLSTGMMENYGGTESTSQQITKVIDKFQQKVKCCGATGPKDWGLSKWYIRQNVSGNLVPISCCAVTEEACDVTGPYERMTIFRKGCIVKTIKFAQHNIWVFSGFGSGIAVAQMCGLSFSYVLYRAFKSEGERYMIS